VSVTANLLLRPAGNSQPPAIAAATRSPTRALKKSLFCLLDTMKGKIVSDHVEVINFATNLPTMKLTCMFGSISHLSFSSNIFVEQSQFQKFNMAFSCFHSSYVLEQIRKMLYMPQYVQGDPVPIQALLHDDMDPKTGKFTRFVAVWSSTSQAGRVCCLKSHYPCDRGMM
jgi:hypothetical protein